MTNESYNVDEANIGRVLHYVIEKYGKSQCRPALVVEDWPAQGKPGYVNLCVFPDGTNDGKYGTDNHDHGNAGDEGYLSTRTQRANLSMMTHWETSVLPNHAIRAIGSWHWPRECSSMGDPMEDWVDPDTKEKAHHNHGDGVVDVRNCYACTRQERYVKENVPSA